jgi:hypothetical protein
MEKRDRFVAGADFFVLHGPSTLEGRQPLISLSELRKSEHCYYFLIMLFIICSR